MAGGRGQRPTEGPARSGGGPSAEVSQRSCPESGLQGSPCQGALEGRGLGTAPRQPGRVAVCDDTREAHGPGQGTDAFHCTQEGKLLGGFQQVGDR